ncbi:DUF945 family protein [Desulfurivibrio alkaliphilus]|uniref:DUF945 family protein n=1 Tax=Desulfurivibrio alkaliphilus (strain DSM 19089 / UNIQEM U267 / AHT2) TaxID=589865 RepID=D6Z6H0_DESAT|nr:DUF945 family protein [Desulfurivibrio alkaliphilus]ADH84929.1 protein of unknown function DUF945 [Desulfurivibrio alkaliphilus AHT 2]
MPAPKPKKLLRLWLPLIAGAALLAIAAAAYFIGLQAEQHFARSVARLNDQHRFQLELVSYQRHLFTAQAVTRLHQQQPPAAAEQLEEEAQQMVHHLQHGPLPLLWGFSAQSPRPSLRPLLAAINSRLLSPAGTGREELLQAHTIVTFGGLIRSRFRLAAGQQQDPDTHGLTLIWQELAGELVVPVNLEKLEGKLSTAGLTLAGPAGSETTARVLELKGVELDFGYQQQRDDQDGITLQAQQRLELAAINSAGEQYGPLRLALHWHNLDRQAAGDMLRLTPWWQRLLLGPNGSQMPPATAQNMVETLARLLAKSPAVEINPLQLATPHGEAEARLHMAYRHRANGRPFHPIMLLSGLQLNIEANAPERLLTALSSDYQLWRQAPAESSAEDSTTADQAVTKSSDPLAGLHQRGYLNSDPDSNQVSFQLRYQNGELTINDRPAPLQALRHLLR